MKPWLHKIELIVDKLIPYSLIILLFIIIGEIFFHEEIEPYGVFVNIVDNTIIAIFVLDLIFKYVRMSNFPNFLRKYWLEIIARSNEDCKERARKLWKEAHELTLIFSKILITLEDKKKN